MVSLHVSFTLDAYSRLRWTLNSLDDVWKSKDGVFDGEVLQKSEFSSERDQRDHKRNFQPKSNEN